jgi:hypothetical protein
MHPKVGHGKFVSEYDPTTSTEHLTTKTCCTLSVLERAYNVAAHALRGSERKEPVKRHRSGSNKVWITVLQPSM